MQLFCSGKWFTWKPFFVYITTLCLWVFFCVCMMLLPFAVILPLLWHLHFDCFVVLCFCFAYLQFRLHTNFVHSSHVIKTNIVYSSRCKCITIRAQSTHLLRFSLFILFHSISAFSTKSNGFEFFSFCNSYTYRCIHLYFWVIISVYMGSCGDKLSGSSKKYTHTDRH